MKISLVKLNYCHCGSLTQRSKGLPQENQNFTLWVDYCLDCSLVRCDAYPGACREGELSY